MSNARSPREVCSTTMGIRGLTWGMPRSGLGPAGRPELRRRDLRLLRGRRPELLTGLGLLDGYRHRRLHQEVDRPAQPQVVAEGLERPAPPDLGQERLGVA